MLYRVDDFPKNRSGRKNRRAQHIHTHTKRYNTYTQHATQHNNKTRYNHNTTTRAIANTTHTTHDNTHTTTRSPTHTLTHTHTHTQPTNCLIILSRQKLKKTTHT